MNNDSSPIPADSLPQASTSEQAGHDPISNAAPAEEQRPQQTRAQKRAEAQVKKKYEFVNSLMSNLDVLIYAELCILYYMDCSLFRFLIRVLSQMMFLSPKPNFIPPMPKHRPYIGAIFGPNIICGFLHIITARSEAGEAMRGYLHGGVIIDLIGYKGPSSKLHLLLLDMLVLALQCFMLAVHVERERLAAVLAAFSKPAVSTDQQSVDVVSVQDHDAEERGVMQENLMNNGDIEMQAMASQNDGRPINRDNEHTEEDQDRQRLLRNPPPREETEDDDNPLDTFWMGSAVVADFHVLTTLRKQWHDYGNASGSALQTVGFSAEFAAVTANRRLTAAGQRFQRSISV